MGKGIMQERQKTALARFMSLVVSELHPHFGEYPIAEMELFFIGTQGTFIGTPYQDHEKLISAFLMNKCFEMFESEEAEKMTFFFMKNYDKDSNTEVERVINLDKLSCVTHLKNNVEDSLILGFDDGDAPLIVDFNESSSQELWKLLKKEGTF